MAWAQVQEAQPGGDALGVHRRLGWEPCGLARQMACECVHACGFSPPKHTPGE